MELHCVLCCLSLRCIWKRNRVLLTSLSPIQANHSKMVKLFASSHHYRHHMQASCFMAWCKQAWHAWLDNTVGRRPCLITDTKFAGNIQEAIRNPINWASSLWDLLPAFTNLLNDENKQKVRSILLGVSVNDRSAILNNASTNCVVRNWLSQVYPTDL